MDPYQNIPDPDHFAEQEYVKFHNLKLWPHLSVMSSLKSLLEQANLDQASFPPAAILTLLINTALA